MLGSLEWLGGLSAETEEDPKIHPRFSPLEFWGGTRLNAQWYMVLGRFTRPISGGSGAVRSSSPTPTARVQSPSLAGKLRGTKQPSTPMGAAISKPNTPTSQPQSRVSPATPTASPGAKEAVPPEVEEDLEPIDEDSMMKLIGRTAGAKNTHAHLRCSCSTATTNSCLPPTPFATRLRSESYSGAYGSCSTTAAVSAQPLSMRSMRADGSEPDLCDGAPSTTPNCTRGSSGLGFARSSATFTDLPRGGVHVQTPRGNIQFGMPPETIKVQAPFARTGRVGGSAAGGGADGGC